MMLPSLIGVYVMYKSDAFILKQHRQLNVISDFIILQVAYFFLIFKMVDIELNFDVGYVPITIVGVYILFCFAYVIYTSITGSSTRIRNWYKKYKYLQKRC